MVKNLVEKNRGHVEVAGGEEKWMFEWKGQVSNVLVE